MGDKLSENWAQNVEWTPAEIAYPSTELEIQEIVLRAANDRKKLRVIGAGHSFTALCETDSILMSLDSYQGLISVDHDRCQATVRGGTRLKLLGELLFQEGMAMENLGDIDVQSIAGTISTGTHGTGKSFGTISTQVVALKFVNGKGELVSCSVTEETDLFRAAQVSLGLLGIIIEVTLQCVPVYTLLLQNHKESLDAVLSTVDTRNDENRNFEYYWLPYTKTAWTKATNITTEKPDRTSFLNYWTEFVLENYSFKVLCEIARLFPSQNQRISRIVAMSVPTGRKVNYSHKIYVTQRLVKFTEMEYNIPAEAYQEVWKEVVRTINRGRFDVHFPIENRWVKGDDIFLSPASGRDSAYIACHVYQGKDFRDYFHTLEEIFRSFGGRPHWGKMNTLTADDVREIYPEFSRFERIRQLHDPDGVFINPYVEMLLGVS